MTDTTTTTITTSYTITPTSHAHFPQKAHLRQTQICKPFLCYKTLFYLVAHNCSPHHQHGWVERPFCPKSIFFVLANTMRWNFYNGLISRNICNLLNFLSKFAAKKFGKQCGAKWQFTMKPSLSVSLNCRLLRKNRPQKSKFVNFN